MLARRLNWPFALPLLAAALFPGAGSRPGGLENPADRAEVLAIVFAYAKAAARAPATCQRSWGRRAQKLQDAAPNCAPRGQGPR